MNSNKKDSYKLTGSLGVGGFGNVYKAFSSDGKIVALKKLSPHLLKTPGIIDRFHREAKILSRLNHPNICKLLDYFTDGPGCIIVLEYIDGIDLKEFISNEPGNLIPIKLAKDIACQCLSAFQYAYEMGVLHRDIKPSNIMVDKNGKCTIMDFGIAEIPGDHPGKTSSVILSPAYTPPERFRDEEKADIRSEIYSTGMVFYELFTGRKPFDSIDRIEIELWHKKEIPRPANRLNLSLSPKISAAISTALEKNPENRFRDFMEFKKAMGLDENMDENNEI